MSTNEATTGNGGPSGLSGAVLTDSHRSEPSGECMPMITPVSGSPMRRVTSAGS